MNAWAAIDLPSLLIGLANLRGQTLIFPLAFTGYTTAPGVIATFRNSQHTTHRFHGILLLMLGNELISPSYVLENTMKAFPLKPMCQKTTKPLLHPHPGTIQLLNPYSDARGVRFT
jgi:hypothetical protein